MDDSLHSYGKAMEDKFFNDLDQKLVDNLRAEMSAKESLDALGSASGIDDESVLSSMAAMGITAEALTSVSLIPLVAVAWADDKMNESEIAAILQAADVAGIKTGTASYETVQAWLKKKPCSQLLETWKAYVGSLKGSLEEAAVAQLKNSILGRAQQVAESAGGFLGLGNKISDAERKVLDDLAKAF